MFPIEHHVTLAIKLWLQNCEGGNHMKKLSSLLLIVLIVLTLASCDSPKSNQESPTTEDNSTETSGEFLKPFDTSGTISPTVLVDQDGVKITANSIDYADYDLKVEITIDNNSDMDIYVGSNNMGSAWNQINGTMVYDGWIYEEIKAGESVDATMNFRYRTLEIYGINEIADMVLSFDVNDLENYETLFVADGKLETSLKGSHDYDTNYYQGAIINPNIMAKNEYTVENFDDSEIFNVSGVKVSSVAAVKNSSDETALFLEFNNDSPDDYVARILNLKLNDALLYEYYWDSLNLSANSKAILDVDLSYLLEQAEDSELPNPETVSSFTFELTFDDRHTGQELYRQELTIDLPNISVGYEVDD